MMEPLKVTDGMVDEPWRCNGCNTLMVILERGPHQGKAPVPAYMDENQKLCSVCREMEKAEDTEYFRKLRVQERDQRKKGRERMGLD